MSKSILAKLSDLADDLEMRCRIIRDTQWGGVGPKHLARYSGEASANAAIAEKLRAIIATVSKD